jgi:hypothetical protein
MTVFAAFTVMLIRFIAQNGAHLSAVVRNLNIKIVAIYGENCCTRGTDVHIPGPSLFVTRIFKSGTYLK